MAVSQYELAVTPQDWAEAYIENFAKLAGYIERMTPPARIVPGERKVTLKFTAIGRKWRHHIYVEFVPHPEKNVGIFKVRPPYPVYLLAVMIPFATVSYPAVILPVKNEIRALMVPDYELAVKTLADAMTKFKLLDPADFGEESGVAFEGYLYRTPIGYVAFVEEKPHFRLVDVIEAHLEEEEDGEDVMHPADFFKMMMEKAYGIRIP